MRVLSTPTVLHTPLQTPYNATCQSRSLRKVQHNPPLHLPLLHIPEHIRQLIHLRRPIVGRHQAPARKIHRLDRLPTIPDRHTHNLERLGHQELRHGAGDGDGCALRDADADQRAAFAEKFDGLGVGGLVVLAFLLFSFV